MPPPVPPPVPPSDPSSVPRPVPRPVRIHYHRPPDREQIFQQTLVHDGVTDPLPGEVGEVGGGDALPGEIAEDDAATERRRVLVSYLAKAGVPAPVTVEDRVVLEARSPVVWFTFPGAHHDIGRFHTPDGALTGYYANILTPVEIVAGAADGVDVWRTTDLFLDVFLTPGGEVHVLDEDELRTAVRKGWVDAATARGAREEADRLAGLARRGEWPPGVVEEWTLERAREVVGGGSGGLT